MNPRRRSWRAAAFALDIATLANLEEKRKRVQVLTQQFQAERNAKSRAIGMAKGKGEDTSTLMKEVADIGAALKQAETELDQIQNELTGIALSIPNIPHESVPDGKTRTTTLKSAAGASHACLIFSLRTTPISAKALGLMDFEAAAKISGARFVVMYSELARMHRGADPVHARPAFA